MTNPRRIAMILVCAATAATAAACGSSHGDDQTQSQTQIKRQADSAAWSGLTRVSVDVDQPSVAPVPGNPNKPTTFTTPAQLTTITKALNANHIRKVQHATTSSGCTGGIVIKLTITRGNHGRTALSAYHCANTVTGDIAGNLTGFLKQIGVSTP